jgi:hypothetical protein
MNRQLFSEIPNAAFLPFAAEGSLPAPLCGFQVDRDPSGANSKPAPFRISEKTNSDHLTLEAAR